jgi:hypothetical protein
MVHSTLHTVESMPILSQGKSSHCVSFRVPSENLVRCQEVCWPVLLYELVSHCDLFKLLVVTFG